MFSALNERIGPRLRRVLMLLLALAMMGLPLYSLPAQASQAAQSAGIEAPAHARHAGQDLGLEEILARHYEAIGGDNFQRVQTMKITGRSIVMGMEAPYTRYTKRPDKFLLEIYVQGMTGIQAFDGPLVHAQDNGHQVELIGRERVGGRDAYRLRLTMSTGGVQTHYVDAETFYVMRVETVEGESDLHDYRVIDGHPVPSVIEILGPWGEQTIYIDDVEFDVPIDDAAFSMQ